MQGWQAAELPVEGSGKKVIDVLRQVQMTVGTMILAGVLLGHFVAPGWLILAGFAGCGLLLAGLTGECPLALLIAKLPWNKSGAACPLERRDPLTRSSGVRRGTACRPRRASRPRYHRSTPAILRPSAVNSAGP